MSRVRDGVERMTGIGLRRDRGEGDRERGRVGAATGTRMTEGERVNVGSGNPNEIISFLTRLSNRNIGILMEPNQSQEMAKYVPAQMQFYVVHAVVHRCPP